MSYQKKDGRGHARPSFFWYDNDKDLKVCFSRDMCHVLFNLCEWGIMDEHGCNILKLLAAPNPIENSCNGPSQITKTWKSISGSDCMNLFIFIGVI